ncbi:MAG TPA: hypothetical protein VIF40_16215 [Methylosinus sp.]|uniref:hypothetical protein n=1 Tax=Methylosinus sp. TaxID=427 RepID=UPI002F9308D7
MADSPNTRTLLNRRLFLAAGSAGAVFGALSAAVAVEVGDPLSALIERHRDIYKQFNDICKIEGDIEASDPLFEAVNEEWRRLDDAECLAMGELLDFPVNSLEQMKAKASYLRGYFGRGHLEGNQFMAFLDSLIA